jgi:hypothetical protein
MSHWRSGWLKLSVNPFSPRTSIASRVVHPRAPAAVPAVAQCRSKILEVLPYPEIKHAQHVRKLHAGRSLRVTAADAPRRTGKPGLRDAERALLGLWRVQADSLRKHLEQAPTPARLHELVTADVRRAARLIDTGLRAFATTAHLPR